MLLPMRPSVPWLRPIVPWLARPIVSWLLPLALRPSVDCALLPMLAVPLALHVCVLCVWDGWWVNKCGAPTPRHRSCQAQHSLLQSRPGIFIHTHT